jgi:DNA-binding MarR family transcriptional regulator
VWQLDAPVHRAYRRGKLSPSQYNVLRILRGSPVLLSGTEIASRMVTRDSDLTRLLRGLEIRGLVSRQRSAADARRIENGITAKGRACMKQLDEPVTLAIRSQLRPAGRTKLKDLVDLLAHIRRVAASSA